MAASDARPVPLKNTAYRHYFAIRKNDGKLITTWAGQDSELSADGAAFADATNEATEIGTSGVGYIDLTSGEMNYDCVVLKVTVTNTDALPYVVTLFPEESGDIRCDATKLGGTSQTGRDIGASVLLAADQAFNVTKVNGTAQTAGDLAALLTTIDGIVDTIVADILAAVDTEVAAIKTKTDSLPSATAGAAGGVFIAGTNAPVMITGSGAALTLTSTGSNGSAMVLTSHGSGHGMEFVVAGLTSYAIFTGTA